MIDTVSDLLDDIPKDSSDEIFQLLLKNEKVRIERIISYGQVTDESYWYDQKKDEFIIVLQGSAKIKYENEQIFDLKVGSSLYIPSHTKHQVIYTENKTVWLALFIS